jgi:predicted AlkP superfamily pyrophosphatase or phosphodiesterase
LLAEPQRDSEHADAGSNAHFTALSLALAAMPVRLRRRRGHFIEKLEPCMNPRWRRRVLSSLLATASLVATSNALAASPVLLVSIDGLRAGDVIEAKQRGLDLPELSAFLHEGSYATGVTGVTPTVTYPSHTTLVTGVAPAVHGIYSNYAFDPTWHNDHGWNWYAQDIRVTTLWQAVRDKGGKTASLMWPVSVGAPIDYNLPELWRSGSEDDRKLLRAVSTPGLLDEADQALGVYPQVKSYTAEDDARRAEYAAWIWQHKHPQLLTLHLNSLDSVEHDYGPGTPQAKADLTRLDQVIGKLRRAVTQNDPNTIVAIVSDHGFAGVQHDVNLFQPFIEAGLITLAKPKQDDPEAKRTVASWQATPWPNGGSYAIVLQHPEDQAMQVRVRALLDKLAADPRLGIERILDAKQIAEQGGNPQASFYVGLKLGYESSESSLSPLVGAPHELGTHGYLRQHAEMNATFLIAGPGIPAGKSLGQIDMRDIAPTLAKLLEVQLPQATGKPLL